MVSHARWEAECLLMKNVFRPFIPFATNGVIGFRGKLAGKRTGRIYAVIIQAGVHTYPAYEPAVYMNPHPEPHHWINDGRLCYRRDGRVWNPDRGTFANTLLIASKYVNEFD